MALGLLASAMYISCIFHVVCASFSALATRKLADAEANSSGIWALVHIHYLSLKAFTSKINSLYVGLHWTSLGSSFHKFDPLKGV